MDLLAALVIPRSMTDRPFDQLSKSNIHGLTDHVCVLRLLAKQLGERGATFLGEAASVLDVCGLKMFNFPSI